MSVTITTSLVPAGPPPPVQLVIDGIPSGGAYTVTGVVGASSWPVPGGVGVSGGGQVVLVDNRTALNLPVTYRVVTDGQAYDAAPITVPHEGARMLQSLDGTVQVPFDWLPNRLPLAPSLSAGVYDVPGRVRPVVRTVVGGDGGGELRIRTTPSQTAALQRLLRKGAPAVLRTDGRSLDLPVVSLLLVTGATSQLAYDTLGMSADRVWSLSYLLVDDPQPSAVLSAFTWDDFDDAMATRTWADFDALFAGSTWDSFDTYPWTQL